MLETGIAKHESSGVTFRGLSLEEDLIGKVSYTDGLALGVLGQLPTSGQRRVLDACLVALMEGGLNPSTLVARMLSLTQPEDSQVAIAAGLLTVGDVYVGSVEPCARVLRVVATAADPRAYAAATVSRHRAENTHIPGLGHGTHSDQDPRAAALTEVARQTGTYGSHAEALTLLRAAANEAGHTSLVVNVTGAVAAALLDIGCPVEATRAITVVARAGGLVAHILEEANHPISGSLWQHAREHVAYRHVVTDTVSP